MKKRKTRSDKGCSVPMKRESPEDFTPPFNPPPRFSLSLEKHQVDAFSDAVSNAAFWLMGFVAAGGSYPLNDLSAIKALAARLAQLKQEAK